MYKNVLMKNIVLSRPETVVWYYISDSIIYTNMVLCSYKCVIYKTPYERSILIYRGSSPLSPPQPSEMLLIQRLINPCQESCRCYDPSFIDVEQASIGFCS